ncbi:protein FAM200C-like [Macrobrachium rosenbergii]|uniref:protein FAM200C-like n=1 Tax=Macrobrachium rosenbergii TaxID=79674 RepID=UPI0034D4C952
MSRDIKDQVISEIKAAQFGLLALQLDESTDVSSCSQLLVFVRYVNAGEFKEEFLFCSPLETTTRGEDITRKVTHNEEGLSWENVWGVCTDEAPAMLGSKSGFAARLKEVAFGVTVTHCMIHCQALASRTLPKELHAILNTAIKIVNYVKSMPVNSRLFKELCKVLDSKHQVLLFYTKVRWLSKGNVLSRVFELREELKIYLDMQGKESIFFSAPVFEPRLAYLVDVFDQLNKLNLKLQGKDKTVIHFVDSLHAFIAKIQNWVRKINAGNSAMFENFCEVVEGEKELDPCLQNEIINHLQNLGQEFSRYFPGLESIDLSFIADPFNTEPDSVPDPDQDEYLEMKFDSGVECLQKDISVQEFWAQISASYRRIDKRALKTLLPSSSTYLCESGFSVLLQIKTKPRNHLEVEDDMRCALSTVLPRFDEVVDKKQVHPSH